MQNQPKDVLTQHAVGLIVTGAFNAMLGLLSLLSYLLRLGQISQGRAPRVYANEAERAGALTAELTIVGVSFLGIVTAPLIIAGAMRMLKRKNYSLAKTAAILAIIPCVSPCCLLGIPLGIRALVALNKPEVKASFEEPPINPYSQM
jgi:hypothetical protein